MKNFAKWLVTPLSVEKDHRVDASLTRKLFLGTFRPTEYKRDAVIVAVTYGLAASSLYSSWKQSRESQEAVPSKDELVKNLYAQQEGVVVTPDYEQWKANVQAFLNDPRYQVL